MVCFFKNVFLASRHDARVGNDLATAADIFTEMVTDSLCENKPIT